MFWPNLWSKEPPIMSHPFQTASDVRKGVWDPVANCYRPFGEKPTPVDNTEDVGMMLKADEGRSFTGGWMELRSGTRFYPLGPQPEHVHLSDIAHALARINRYNGHIKLEHYSVAEHSALMATWMLGTYGCPLLAYQALFHDAPEAYIGDMVRPLKREMPAFVAAEEPVWRAVVQAFPILQTAGNKQCQLPEGRYYELDPRVKEADNRILVDERAQVMAPSGNPWGIDHMEPLGIHIQGLRPMLAEADFLSVERTLRAMVVAHG